MIFKKHLLFSLSEGKIDDVNEKYSDIDAHTKSKILDSIPHSNAQHYDWALKQRQNLNLNTDKDSLEQLNNTLTSFNTHKDKLSKKNIHQYKSIDELSNATEPHIKPKDDEVVYQSPTMKVTKHNNYQSVIKSAWLQPDNEKRNDTNMPGKAEWCVSAHSIAGHEKYKEYTMNGKNHFYTIETKTPTGSRKYALVKTPHLPLSKAELRDEKDQKPYVDNTKYESYSIQDDSPYNHINLFAKNHPEIMKTPLHSFFSGTDNVNQKHREMEINAGRLNHDELDHVFNDPSQHNSRMVAAYSPNTSSKLSEKHLNSLFNYKGEDITKDRLATHEKLSHAAIQKGLDDEHLSPMVKTKLAGHKNASEENLDTALKSDRGDIQREAIKNPNITVKNLPTALDNNKSYTIAGNEFNAATEAMKHPKLTSHHIQKILTSPDYDEKQKLIAIKHPNASEENLLTAIHHQHPYSRDIMAYRAVTHPNATPKVWDEGMKHDNEEVQQKAASLKNEKGS